MHLPTLAGPLCHYIPTAKPLVRNSEPIHDCSIIRVQANSLYVPGLDERDHTQSKCDHMRQAAPVECKHIRFECSAYIESLLNIPR